jgi:glycosyltransferase EpsF
MDLFVFPSLFEGVPLVVVEAQASGLDCIVASHLPVELEAVPQLMRRLPL